MNAKPIEIGKYIIDTLTTGMYEDSLFIFREYIQNAADQVDKAIREGLIEQQEAEIHIQISNSKRLISIHDNATGIATEAVRSLLVTSPAPRKSKPVAKASEESVV